MTLYRVMLPKGVTAGLEVSPDGIVIAAAPVLLKSVGLRITTVKAWAKKKGGTVTAVSAREEEKKFTGR